MVLLYKASISFPSKSWDISTAAPWELNKESPSNLIRTFSTSSWLFSFEVKSISKLVTSKPSSGTLISTSWV